MLQQNLTPPPSVGTERSSSRLLRSAAAITLAVCLSAFAAAPAWSYKAGTGADDVVVAETYANAAAYLADANRTQHDYVIIAGNIYDVDDLEAVNDQSGLTDSNLPSSLGPETTAVGDGAAATGRESTALGHNAQATGEDSTAIGESAHATGEDSTAIGQNTAATADDSTAVGRGAQAYGSDSTALGQRATAFSEDTVSVGQGAKAVGDDATAVGELAATVGRESIVLGNGARNIGAHNTVLGRAARAANIPLGTSTWDYVGDIGLWADCAHQPNAFYTSFLAEECGDFLLQSEIDDPLLSADSQAGIDFRATVQQRLRDDSIFQDYNVERATAVGAFSGAYGRYGTSLGYFAHSAERSTSLGGVALASGERSVAIGFTATVTGDNSVAVGDFSQANGERGVAIGRRAAAGSWTVWNAYADVADYNANHPEDSTDTFVAIGGDVYAMRDLEAVGTLTENNLPEPVAAGTTSIFSQGWTYDTVERYLSDTNRLNHHLVVIGGNIYRVSELEAISGLTAANLPDPLNGNDNAIAIGFSAQAPSPDSIAMGTEAIALGDGAMSIGNFARTNGRSSTAVGNRARASGLRTTVVGDRAQVTGDDGTAVGQYSSAVYGSIGIGSGSVASGDRSTAVGTWSNITGDFSTGLGEYAQSHGTHGVALGRHAGAGSWTIWSHYDNAADFVANHGEDLTDTFVVIANRIYSVRDLKAVASLTDANLPTPVSTSAANVIGPLHTYRSVESYLGDSTRTNYHDVIVGDHAYAVSDLEAVAGLTEETLPVPLTGDEGAIAIGHSAQAPARDAIAIGREAVVLGDEGIAIGHRVVAGENDVVVGTTDHDYWLPGLSASQTANTELVSVDSSGQLASDGGALHARVDSVETGLGVASDSASATGSAYARINSLRQLVDALGNNPSNADVAVLRQAVQDVEAALGAPNDAASATGTAYARIADVQSGLQTVEDSLGSSSDAADAAGSAFARVRKLQTDLGESTDSASASGSAYARIASTQAGLQSVETSLGGPSDTASATGTAFARIAHVSNELGTSADAASATGSAYARINQLQTGLGEQSDAASATGSAYARISHFKEALEDAESEDVAFARALSETRALSEETQSLVRSTIADTDGLVDQIEMNLEERLAEIQTNAKNQVLRIITRGADGGRTVVALRGPTNEQIQTLVALLTSGAGAGDVIVDLQGNPVGTSAREFRALDDPNNSGDSTEPEPIPIGSNNRLGYLFEALYGDPNDGVVYNPNTDTDTPHEESAFGRIGALEEGSLTSTYRQAPEIGSGTSAPRTADQRRIVVQDENADGSIRLSTISFSDITTVDRRVTDLGERLDQATAMTSALSGLPSMVPGTGEKFLGVGLGSYGGESAVAVGGAARLGGNVFVNIGASTTSSGGDNAFRAGAGIVW